MAITGSNKLNIGCAFPYGWALHCNLPGGRIFVSIPNGKDNLQKADLFRTDIQLHF